MATVIALREDTRLKLIVTLLLALTLRVATVGRESLWFDEAISYLTAQLSLLEISLNAIQDPHPPLYYLILHVWTGLGFSDDAVVHLPDIFSSLLLIPIVYQLGRRLLSTERQAMIATFLAAISPFHVIYSNELRMYAWYMLVTASLTLAYLKARDTGTNTWWLAFGLLSLVAIYTHLFAFTVLAAIGIHALLNRSQRQPLRRTVVTGLSLLVLFLPWIYILLGESQYNLGSLRPLAQTGARELPFIRILITVTFLLFGPSTTLWYSGMALFVTLALTTIFIMELVKRRRASEESPGLSLPILITLCAIGIPIGVHTARPFFLPERTMAAAAPFFILLLAWATTRRRSPLPYLVAGSALLMLSGTILYHSAGPQKPPYRTVGTYLNEQRQAGDAVLHTSDGSYLSVLRYTQFENHGLLQGDPDPRKPRAVYEMFGGEIWTLDEAIRKGTRLWVIVAREHSVGWQEEQLAYFESNLQQLAAHDIGGITINLYATEHR